jgi:hypothetical protein
MSLTSRLRHSPRSKLGLAEPERQHRQHYGSDRKCKADSLLAVTTNMVIYPDRPDGAELEAATPLSLFSGTLLHDACWCLAYGLPLGPLQTILVFSVIYCIVRS